MNQVVIYVGVALESERVPSLLTAIVGYNDVNKVQHCSFSFVKGILVWVTSAIYYN